MAETVTATHWLFVSDVDDTLLGDDEALARLASALENARDAIQIAYNSSRPIASVLKSIAVQPRLPVPDYVIGALGTEIACAPDWSLLDGYASRLNDDWWRDEIATWMNGLGFQPHADEYQTRFKVSYDVPGEENHRRIVTRLEALGYRVKVIYSGDKNLDIIPAGAGKGEAADYLRRRLGLEVDRVVVAGDSANDRDLFKTSFKGIVVANADRVMQALSGSHIYHTRASYAAGVLEGLQHWGVVGS